MSMSYRKTGAEKWFKQTKWDGFIELEIDNNILVHYSAIQLEAYRDSSKGKLSNLNWMMG